MTATSSPSWRHCPRKKVSCGNASKIADAIAVALIFNIVAMDKAIPTFLFTIVGEEEKINL